MCPDVRALARAEIRPRGHAGRPRATAAVLEVRPACRRSNHARADGGGFARVHGEATGGREHPCADLLLDGRPGLALAGGLTAAGSPPVTRNPAA
ncbi:hypothetical protein EBL87_08905 [Cereibacter sphaeroides]|nr:hypothetical protein EBL87_08905 [Cereibacter sphaeroides]AZB68231.1 hypothetical protein EBL86_07570 [Cereibacter sphaeroides]